MKNGEFVVSENKPIVFNLAILVACLLIGTITALIVYFVTKHRYRFKKSQNSSVYIKHEKTVFHRKTDSFTPQNAK